VLARFLYRISHQRGNVAHTVQYRRGPALQPAATMSRMLGSNRYRVIDLGRGKTPFRDYQATPWGLAFLQPPHVNTLHQANEDGRTNEVRATI
jgi:hypothetical protein